MPHSGRKHEDAENLQVYQKLVIQPGQPEADGRRYQWINQHHHSLSSSFGDEVGRESVVTSQPLLVDYHTFCWN